MDAFPVKMQTETLSLKSINGGQFIMFQIINNNLFLIRIDKPGIPVRRPRYTSQASGSMSLRLVDGERISAIKSGAP